MVIDLNFDVDIRKGVMPQHVTQPLYYDDQNAHRIIASLYRGQQQIDLTGLSCNGYVTFVKDGTSIGPLVGEVSGNTCSIVLPHEAYYYPGAIRIELKLIEGEEVTTVLMLTGQVAGGRGDRVIDIDGAVVPSLDAIASLIEDFREASLSGRNSTISPVYIGDYLSETVPSCCVRIGNDFIAIDALDRSYATSEGTNVGKIRKFDTANNVEVTLAAPDQNVGHANSIAYDGTTVYVVPIWENSSEGVESSANYLYTFNSDMTPTEEVKLYLHENSTSAMGVSYDPVAQTLYYLDYNYRIYAKTSDGWALVTTVDMTGVSVTEFNSGSYFNQDFAVYDGMFYISSPRGVIVSGKIEPATSTVTGGCIVGSTDILNRYMLGELEGMEFDSKGHLFAMMYSGLSNEVRDAFIVELPIGVTRSNASSTDSYDFHDGTLTLSEATQRAFWLQPYEIRTISQLEIRILRYNSSAITVPENNNVVDDYSHRINDRVKLNLIGTLTVSRFEILSGLLNIGTDVADDGTPRLIFTAASSALVVTRAGELAITGRERLRISTPNRSSAQLIDVAYDFNRTTIRLVPTSHQSKAYCIGPSTVLDDYSVYAGTGKISGAVKTVFPSTYTTNNYFTRTNIMSGGFLIKKISSTMSVIQTMLKVSTNTLPAGTSVQVGNLPFTPAYSDAHTYASDGYGNLVMIYISRSANALTIKALDNDIPPLDNDHAIRVLFPVATDPW